MSTVNSPEEMFSLSFGRQEKTSAYLWVDINQAFLVIEDDLLDETDLTGGGRDNQEFLAKHGVDIKSMISPEIL
jgi:hypothetical protein